MDKGLIQLYYGNGKGKTTAGVGSCVRAAGHGLKVLVYQFLKTPANTGEVSMLKSIPGIEYVDNTVHSPFLFNLTPEQQEYFAELYDNEFEAVLSKIYSGEYDLVFLDELIDAWNLNLIPRDKVLKLMETKPAGTELIISGHIYEESIDELIARSDYVTEFKKVKHPFDNGECARIGIEE
ncbi:MAG: cob(I)yrinic acid a,c-diamide adenosyltransferase [Eubacteriales bacterium]|nr:cob(I)yrinic acid a,c-diamide adenosyltransferase [Eubacteriales bacterium]